jgi:hypothetical protein
MKWALFIVAWAAWQLLVLFLAFVVWANIFSEYGIYQHRLLGAVAAVLFMAASLYLGIWVPLRRWRGRAAK